MIEIKNISKSFYKRKRKRAVLTDVSIDFYKNEVTFISGKSGIGKSTLMKIIAGYINPDNGTIIYNGVIYSNGKNINGISYFSQKCYLFENLSIFDNLNLYYDYDLKELSYVLENLSIFDLLNRKINSLSSGEKQRVQLALAILTKSKILLLDEPTSNLDKINSEKLLKLIKKYLYDVYVIVISHNELISEKYGNRIYKFEKDRSVTEIFNDKCEELHKNDHYNLLGKKKSILNISLKILQNCISSTVIFIISFICIFFIILVIVSIDKEKYHLDLLNDELNRNGINVIEIDTPLSANEIDYIENIDGVGYVESVYDNRDIPLVYDSNLFSRTKYENDDYKHKIAKYNENFFYKDRLIYGSLPDSDDEVIISLQLFMYGSTYSKRLYDAYISKDYDLVYQIINYKFENDKGNKITLYAPNDSNDFEKVNEYVVSGVFLYYDSFNETDILFYDIDSVFEILSLEYIDSNNRNIYLSDYSYPTFKRVNTYLESLGESRYKDFVDTSNIRVMSIILPSIYGQYTSFSNNLYIIQIFMLIVFLFAIFLFVKFMLSFLVIIRMNKCVMSSYIILAYSIALLLVSSLIFTSIFYFIFSNSLLNSVFDLIFKDSFYSLNFSKLLFSNFVILVSIGSIVVFIFIMNHVMKATRH